MSWGSDSGVCRTSCLKSANNPRVSDNSSANKVPSIPDLDKDSIIKLLECPVCIVVPSPPILLCSRGHNVCQICRQKLTVCPICQSEFTSARNFLAEQLLEKLNSKCQYAKDGCTVQVNVKDWEDHAKTCEFRSVDCNLEQEKKCQNVKVNYSNYFNHLIKVHKIQGLQGTILNLIQYASFEQSCLNYEMSWNIWPVQYMEACSQKFLTGTAVVPGKIFWWLYIIGSDDLAKEYICKISIQNRSQGYEITWTGPTHSFRTTPEAVLSSGKCLLATKESFGPFAYFHMIDANTIQSQWNLTYTVAKKHRPLPNIPTTFNLYNGSDRERLNSTSSNPRQPLPSVGSRGGPRARVKNCAASMEHLNLQ